MHIGPSGITDREFCAEVRRLARAHRPGYSVPPIAYVLLVAMLGAPLPASAQPTQFRRLSVDHGLPSHYITTIYQDSKGFMWFGTDAGLCRYDGRTCKVFKNVPSDTTTLAGNAIWSLCEDRHANLWVGTYSGGLNKLDLKTEKITRMSSTSILPAALHTVPIKALLVDNDVLWIGTFGAGLGMLDLSTNAFHLFTHDSLDPGSIADDVIFWILQDHAGTIWVGTAGGLCAFEPARQTFTRYAHDPRNPRSLSNNIVVTVFEDHRNRLWVGTKNGLNLLDRGTGSFVRFGTPAPRGISNSSVYAIGEHFTRMDTSLWIGTDGGGVNRYDERTHSFHVFVNAASDPSSISDNNVTCMFTDRSGAMWIGTLQGGVNRIDTERKNVRHWRHDPANPNSLPRGGVYSLAQDSLGSFWIGTYAGGLCRYDVQRGLFQRYDQASSRGLASNDISALLTDRSGTLWVGTNAGGLMKFDAHASRFVPFSPTPSNHRRLASSSIDEVIEDTHGVIWIGTIGQGLNMYNPRTDALVRYLPNPSVAHSISHDRVTVIRQSRDGALWIGTEGGGLNRFDPQTRRFSHFRFHLADTNSLSDDLVYAVHEDRHGMVWVGTSNGLNRFNPTTRTFKRYFVRDGLASDYIKGILEDTKGNLWLITARGISRMSLDRKRIVNFDHHDGFINYGFTDAYIVTSTGHILVGGSEGVDIFHPDSLVENENPPPIVLTEFTVYNNPYALPQTIPFTQEISSLEWNQNFFSLSFAVLDFTNPDRNQYAYRMIKEGDPEWLSSGSGRFANFTNLDAGSYVFTATGANSNGVWNTQGVSLRITIKPPFWRTWWFLALMVTAVIALLAVIYNVRVAHLLRIERLRVRIAGDLHDDVGSSLSAIALMTDMVSRRLPPNSPERERLASATAVARTTADALRDIVWLINPEHEKVEDMVLRMKDAASKLLANIHHTFETDERGLTDRLDMDLRRNIILMYKEILNNITKHSQATKVDITMKCVDGQLFLRVRDNGRGFDEATVKRGSGLNNLRQRAEKMGGSLAIESAPGRGTCIELSVKIP
jgi:ligand-binding sensor domain-containing protein/signal transduction histidine kinase